jgi:CHASE2 domain-containing sensor protein/predicted Ser/Thr protein kinase
VIVGLDAGSLAAIDKQLPIPRRYWAQLIDRLHADGARLIAMDLQFIGSTDRADDRALTAAISRSRPVLLATHDSAQGRVPVPAGVRNPASIGAATGSVGVLTDSDGVIRRMPYAPVSLAAFPVRAAELLLGQPISDSHFPDNAAWIDYAGPPGTIPTFAFSDVLAGRIRQGALTGKTVLVGETDPVAKDVFQTGVSAAPMAGTEVLANSLDTILDGFPLAPAGGIVGVLLIVILGALPALVALRHAALFILLASATAVGVLLVGVQIAFDDGRIVTLTSPLLALLVSAAGSSAVDFFIEGRARRSLEESIDRLVKQIKEGDVIGSYHVERVVARGGMGVIYAATQVGLGRQVALKVIAPELAQDPLFRERFKREALMAALIEHPNVVPVYEAGEDGGLLFLAMRFIAGTDLRTMIAEHGRLEPQRAAGLLGDVAAALDAAHRRGLVHRDVKPANVLVTQEDGHDRAYLADFGLSKRTDSDSAMTQTGAVLGTVNYIAPEQLDEEDVDFRADIYALGCMCFELLTGRVPFVRDSELATMFAHASSPVPKARELRPELPESIEAVIARAMAKRPQDRYASAGEFAAAVATALADVTEPHGRE